MWFSRSKIAKLFSICENFNDFSNSFAFVGMWDIFILFIVLQLFIWTCPSMTSSHFGWFRFYWHWRNARIGVYGESDPIAKASHLLETVPNSPTTPTAALLASQNLTCTEHLLQRKPARNRCRVYIILSYQLWSQSGKSLAGLHHDPAHLMFWATRK